MIFLKIFLPLCSKFWKWLQRVALAKTLVED